MKMIDVLSLMAEGKIKKDTKLIVYDGSEEYSYRYSEICRTFFDEYSSRIECDFDIDEDFLNLEVDLIPPKEKKYLVKFNIRGLRNNIDEFCYLNYVKRYEYVDIDDKTQTVSHKTMFTKQELKSIKPVKEFLEDLQGKYELIEVENNEID